MDIVKERRKRRGDNRSSGGSAESFGSPRSVVTFREDVKSKSKKIK